MNFGCFRASLQSSDDKAIIAVNGLGWRPLVHNKIIAVRWALRPRPEVIRGCSEIPLLFKS